MSGYIDPFVSDQELIARDTRLSRKQARDDYLAARAEGGFDGALFARDERPGLLPGFRKIPGASRSGALDPQTRSRFDRLELEGSIEVQRDQYGHLIGYRPLDNTND